MPGSKPPPVETSLCTYLPTTLSRNNTPRSIFSRAGPEMESFCFKILMFFQRAYLIVLMKRFIEAPWNLLSDFPNCATALGGSQFINSPATGRFLDFLCDELVKWVEGEYSVCSSDARGVMGHSSGGFGHWPWE